jgi:Divergent InlB B-repeat domain
MSAGRAVLPLLLFAVIIGWRSEAIGAQLSLSWNSASTEELGFSIERRTGATGSFGEIARTSGGGMTYTDQSVASEMTYCYRIRAFTGTAYSDYSNMACATVPRTVGLAVVKIGAGSGTVTSMPAGISCGASCSDTYTAGTMVTLTASAAAGSSFVGWGGGGCRGTDSCTVTLASTTTVVAAFEPSAPGVSLRLSLSRHTASAGDEVQVSVTARNDGPATSVELYFVILGPATLSSIWGCPDGDAVAFVVDGFSRVLTSCMNTASPASFEPLYRDVSLGGGMALPAGLDLFSFTWPEGVPEGVYTFAIFTAPAGTYAKGALREVAITASASDSLQVSR